MPEAFHLDVGGLTLPRPIAGHPALDLCNTYAGWHDAEGGDYLPSYPHLVAWTVLVGVVEATRIPVLAAMDAASPGAATRVLRQTVRLRASLYAVLHDPHDVTALDVVTAAIRRATGAGTLRPRRDAEGGKDSARTPLSWDVTGSGVAEPLHAIAHTVDALLTRVPLGEISTCPGAGCGWVFHDPSGRRRWCRMEWCGNRMKQRAHTERQRSRQR